MLQLEQLERLFLAYVQGLVAGRVLGADVEVPSWWQVRADFDAALVAEPARVDPVLVAELVALGLREAS